MDTYLATYDSEKPVSEFVKDIFYKYFTNQGVILLFNKNTSFDKVLQYTFKDNNLIDVKVVLICELSSRDKKFFTKYKNYITNPTQQTLNHYLDALQEVNKLFFYKELSQDPHVAGLTD